MSDRITIIGTGDRVTIAEGAPGVGGASGVTFVDGLDGDVDLTDTSTYTALVTSIAAKASTAALTTGLDTKPTSTTVDNIEVVTQAAYDALTPAATTIYVIVG